MCIQSKSLALPLFRIFAPSQVVVSLLPFWPQLHLVFFAFWQVWLVSLKKQRGGLLYSQNNCQVWWGYLPCVSLGLYALTALPEYLTAFELYFVISNHNFRDHCLLHRSHGLYQVPDSFLWLALCNMGSPTSRRHLCFLLRRALR